MNPDPNRPVGFTRKEIAALRLHAVLVAAIGAGMFAVAPKGLGQVLGISFALALLVVPPLVIYWWRRRPNDERRRRV